MLAYPHMADPGSFADRVKQQADIVRVIGEYVPLRKSGQNFTGLCPFHSEKTPSFAVHPTKQIYHCFGCGVGGDVFKFVMEMDKISFPEAVRVVAEKCGIPVPQQRERTPEERKTNQQRNALVEMHREAAAFFARQLATTAEGKAARAYLADRGLDSEAIERFGLGYAPSGGESLVRHLKQKFPDALITQSGLASHDDKGRPFDRFRRRIMFPIANEGGKVIAFGGRSLGDDMPKYLNSPETPIYSKSAVLYHLDRAKEPIRRANFAVLVEGYMDTIGVARAGIENVVASCGTSLTEPQVKLLGRFTKQIIVNYDPDSAGQAATERSLSLLLENDFDTRVLALPPVDGKPADPDLYIQKKGAEAYRDLLAKAPPFLDYLISRAKQMDLTSAQGKLAAVNFLMPHVQRIANPLLRSEWATRIAQQLRIEEPVLREALRKSAAERRSEVHTKPELIARSVRPAERRLVQMLIDADEFRARLVQALLAESLHKGLETESVFNALLPTCAEGSRPDATTLATTLEASASKLLFEIAFEEGAPPTWEEAESCLIQLRRRRVEQELATVQKEIESLSARPAANSDKSSAASAASGSAATQSSGKAPAATLNELLARKHDLRKRLGDH
ncbi:MAG: DNA primase [Candidatus Acidiferrales bacterium]